MKFIFDENLPPTLARGLAAFGEPTEHSTDHFPAGTKDEILLEFIGTNQYIFITRDTRIRFNPQEVAAIRRHNVGAFILQGKSLAAWDIVRQLVRNWHRILELSNKERKPFIYLIPRTGTKIQQLPFK